MSPFPGLSRLTVCPTGLREHQDTFIASFTGFAAEVLCSNCILHLCCLSLVYNSLIWDPHLLKDIRQLDSVQTFACRMATKNWSASGSELQSICHLPSLKTCRMYFKLCFLYKSLNHITHVLNYLFMYRTSGSQCVSHDLQLFCPTANTNSFLFSFVCISVKAWNSLPYVVVHAPSIQIFKCRLKQHLGM